MKVILCADVEKVGAEGTVVDVKPGYARNYLIPLGLGLAATQQRLRNIAHEKKLLADRRKRELKVAESIKDRIEAISVTVRVQVGEEDKLFGTVTNADIAEKLQEQGLDVDKKKIHLAEPIRALGLYAVSVRVAPEVTAELKVFVDRLRPS